MDCMSHYKQQFKVERFDTRTLIRCQNIDVCNLSHLALSQWGQN